MAKTLTKAETPSVSSENGIQTLPCLAGHTWTRPASKGRPPVTCPEHRLYRISSTPAPAKAIPPATEESTPENPSSSEELEHYAAPILRRFMKRGQHAYLFGPSGSFKSEGTKRVGASLGLETYELPCNAYVSAEDLQGYNGPHGYQAGIAREWLENPNGGVLLVDEMDGANPALLLVANLLFALKPGQTFRFPDGVRLERTARHIVVGTGNTNGLGADENYVGRQPLDRATLDRLAFIPWGYDERLELAIAKGIAGSIGERWCGYVQRVRSLASELGLRVMVTPRATIEGATALKDGEPHDIVTEAYVLKGIDADTRETIQRSVKGF